MGKSTEAFFQQMAATAGIEINGPAPWDIQVHNTELFQRVLNEGSLGLGEAYMDKWWDCERVDQFIERVVRARVEDQLSMNLRLAAKLAFFKLINRQSKKRSLEVGRKHYDLGNELFEAMLDKRMNYTCGYWEKATTLDEAQRHKLELTCQKLMLEPGMRLLDIGCGFGALAKYAAENFGVSVVGVTISQAQCEYAKRHCAGLPIEIRFQDYRDVREKFDRVASLGMFEHVGYQNYLQYMTTVKQNLTDNGLFLLHTIGGNISRMTCDEWTTKYIFANSMLPSIAQIGSAAENKFIMEDWQNFGSYYEKTLLAWHRNFVSHWSLLKKDYDERFYRMWTYYLLTSAGSFRARAIQLWQIVYSGTGVKGVYQRPQPDFTFVPSPVEMAQV